jgi:hypothetical protein
MQICEHLPRLAACAPKLALVRSVSHPNSNHTPMIYYTLTGRPTEQPSMDNDVRAPLRTDFPHTGAVVARFKGANEAVPGFVAIPDVAVRSSLSGEFKRARLLLRGGGSGFLGARHDPLAVDGEPGTREAVPALALPGDVSLERFETRRQILSLLDSRGSTDASAADYHAVRQRAFWLTERQTAHSPGPFRWKERQSLAAIATAAIVLARRCSSREGSPRQVYRLSVSTSTK